MSDEHLDRLMADLCKGDPAETVPMPTIERMARAAINAGWALSTTRQVSDAITEMRCAVCGLLTEASE